MEKLFLLVFYIGIISFYIYILIDILKSEFVNSINKLIWLIAVIFLPLIGVILYLFVGKKQKIKNQI